MFPQHHHLHSRSSLTSPTDSTYHRDNMHQMHQNAPPPLAVIPHHHPYQPQSHHQQFPPPPPHPLLQHYPSSSSSTATTVHVGHVVTSPSSIMRIASSPPLQPQPQQQQPTTPSSEDQPGLYPLQLQGTSSSVSGAAAALASSSSSSLVYGAHFPSLPLQPKVWGGGVPHVQPAGAANIDTTAPPLHITSIASRPTVRHGATSGSHQRIVALHRSAELVPSTSTNNNSRSPSYNVQGSHHHQQQSLSQQQPQQSREEWSSFRSNSPSSSFVYALDNETTKLCIPVSQVFPSKALDSMKTLRNSVSLLEDSVTRLPGGGGGAAGSPPRLTSPPLVGFAPVPAAHYADPVAGVPPPLVAPSVVPPAAAAVGSGEFQFSLPIPTQSRGGEGGTTAAAAAPQANYHQKRMSLGSVKSLALSGSQDQSTWVENNNNNPLASSITDLPMPLPVPLSSSALQQLPHVGRHLAQTQQQRPAAEESLSLSVPLPRIPSPLHRLMESQRNAPSTPSICLLFLEGRCRMRERCFQMHIAPTTLDSMRQAVRSSAACCALHDPPSAVAPSWRKELQDALQRGVRTVRVNRGNSPTSHDEQGPPPAEAVPTSPPPQQQLPQRADLSSSSSSPLAGGGGGDATAPSSSSSPLFAPTATVTHQVEPSVWNTTYNQKQQCLSFPPDRLSPSAGLRELYISTALQALHQRGGGQGPGRDGAGGGGGGSGLPTAAEGSGGIADEASQELISVLEAPVKEICRLHHRGPCCKFGDDCRYIHLCRRLSGYCLNTPQTPPSISIPASAAAAAAASVPTANTSSPTTTTTAAEAGPTAAESPQSGGGATAPSTPVEATSAATTPVAPQRTFVHRPYRR